MSTQPDAEQVETEEDVRGATGGQASVTDGQTGEEAERGVRGRSARDHFLHSQGPDLTTRVLFTILMMRFCYTLG